MNESQKENSLEPSECEHLNEEVLDADKANCVNVSRTKKALPPKDWLNSSLKFFNAALAAIVSKPSSSDIEDYLKLCQLDLIVSDVFSLKFVSLVQGKIFSIFSVLEKILSIFSDSEREDLFNLCQLEQKHIDHLISEGFDLHQIARWIALGLASLTEEEAKQRNFRAKDKDGRLVSGSGLYFPFTKDFGQLRLDVPIEREKGSAKYLTPLGAKSQAQVPTRCQVVTEGAKDAAAGSLHGGIPTGAIAGVSHYRKALQQGTGYTILFDADGWINPSVFSNLFHAAKWVGGKVQLLPEIEGFPKAGLCEFFKSGRTAEDYKKLIESAKRPELLLLEWGKHFRDIPESRLSQSVRVALRLAAEYLDDVEQDVLISNIKSASKQVAAKTLSKELEKQRAKVSATRRKKLEESFEAEEEETDPHPEAFFRSICQTKQLEFEDCVTAGTFDGWVYHRIFGASEGDWRVIDSAFYQWRSELGYWQRQDDNKINSLIADAGQKAFKLKYSKEFGWQILKPYETNSHKESAFKYCRSRLERPELLPVNTHLQTFKNCTVDLRTGARMPHDKAHYLTSIIPYDYEPGKDCPEVFRQFVVNSFGEDMLNSIRAFTSMFLDPTAPFGRVPHLIGQSGGGKGSMGRFWSSLFGEEGASSGDFSNLSTAEGRHQYLTGKSIFAIPDAGGFVQGLRAFYELTDNGGMSGRALFNPVGYFKTWNCRFWVASVMPLQVENAADGWARRAYPIPVKARTVKPDPDLRLKLEACKADVISWALAMPRDERDHILLSPPENERVVNLALDSALYGDSTKSFVDLCLQPTPEAGFVPHHLLHTWYVAYCREHGYTPLGMSKFISHLKTVLSRNFVDRGWSPMVDGQRSRISAHWEYLAPLPGAFVKQESEIRDSGENPQAPQNPIWICIKSKCEEGGLTMFEEFWNPPQPPPGNSSNNGTKKTAPLTTQGKSDNKSNTCRAPQTTPSPSVLSDLAPPAPSDWGKSGSSVQGGSIFAESLKQRNSGGVQGGSTVQGRGLGDEKNQKILVGVVETKNENDFCQTPVTEAGHPVSRVDSFNVEQSVSTNEVDKIVVTKQVEKRCNSKIGLWLLQINYLSSNQTQVTFKSPAPEQRVWQDKLDTTESQEVKDYCLTWVSRLTDTILQNRSFHLATTEDIVQPELVESLSAQIGSRCLVQRITGSHLNPVVEWIEATMVDAPSLPEKQNWIFELEDGDIVAIAGEDEWRLADGRFFKNKRDRAELV